MTSHFLGLRLYFLRVATCFVTMQTMRYMDKLLEYSGLLGEIFQGRSSYSMGGSSTESEKRKAVGHYVGEEDCGSLCW